VNFSLDNFLKAMPKLFSKTQLIDPDKIMRNLEIPHLFSDSDSSSSLDRNSFMMPKQDDDQSF
jgi:hypothetical protein